jgi:hypothetical protein
VQRIGSFGRKDQLLRPLLACAWDSERGHRPSPYVVSRRRQGHHHRAPFGAPNVAPDTSRLAAGLAEKRHRTPSFGHRQPALFLSDRPLGLQRGSPAPPTRCAGGAITEPEGAPLGAPRSSRLAGTSLRRHESGSLGATMSSSAPLPALWVGLLKGPGVLSCVCAAGARCCLAWHAEVMRAHCGGSAIHCAVSGLPTKGRLRLAA